jgi:hypothetical protein
LTDGETVDWGELFKSEDFRGDRVPRDTIEGAKVIAVVYRNSTDGGIDRVILEKDGMKYYLVPEMSTIAAKTVPKTY